MSGRLFGYARVSVGSEADVNTLESRLFLEVQSHILHLHGVNVTFMLAC